MPNGYSEQAMESILFHYLFAPLLGGRL